MWDDPIAAQNKVSIKDLKDAKLILSYREETTNMIASWLHARKEDLRIASYINLVSNAEILVKNEGGYCFTIEGPKKDEDLKFIPLHPPIYQLPKIIYKKALRFQGLTRSSSLI